MQERCVENVAGIYGDDCGYRYRGVVSDFLKCVSNINYNLSETENVLQGQDVREPRGGQQVRKFWFFNITGII